MAEPQPQTDDDSPVLLRRTVIKLTAAGAASAVAGGSITGSAAAQQSGEAEIVIPAQESNGFEIEIESATLPDGGFIALIDPVEPHGKAWPEVGQKMPTEEEIIEMTTLGRTGFLEAGTHEGVTIELEEPLDFDHNVVEEFTGKLYQIHLFRDTSGSQEFTNVAPGDTEDPRYTYENEGQHESEVNEIVVGEAYIEHAPFNPNTLESQIEADQERISEIESQLSEIESQLSESESTNEDQQEQISQLESERDSLQSEVDDLNSRIEELENTPEPTPTSTPTEEMATTETDSPGFGIVTTLAGAAVGAAAAAKRFRGTDDETEE